MQHCSADGGVEPRGLPDYHSWEACEEVPPQEPGGEQQVHVLALTRIVY